MGSVPKIIAIDPGVSGAVVGYYPRTHDLFVHRDFKGIKDIVHAVNTSANGVDDIAIIEHVGTRPGQGIVSTGHFMLAYGTALGSLGMKVLTKNLKPPVYQTYPQRWQNWVRREIGIPDDAKTLCEQTLFKPKFTDFDSRVFAVSCFPDNVKDFSRAKDHNTADAALLAVYCFWFGREILLREHLQNVWQYHAGHRIMRPVMPLFDKVGLDGVMKITEDPYEI